MKPTMKLGMFMMPVHPLHRNHTETLREDREAVILADKLGFHDVFIGEHLTDKAENITNSMLFLFIFYLMRGSSNGDDERETWELVDPLGFFVTLTTSCLIKLKYHLLENDLTPYSFYKFGTLWQVLI